CRRPNAVRQQRRIPATKQRSESMRTRRTFLPLLAALAAVPLTGPARAQGWPQRPVKLIVPFAAGGNTDVIARIVAQRLGAAFGLQFIVDNLPDAAGATRAAEAVARA